MNYDQYDSLLWPPCIQVILKLKLALQQRTQLAIQQHEKIGRLLTETISILVERMQLADERQGRERPRGESALDFLDQTTEIGASSSSLQDAIFIYRATSRNMMKFVNEPLTHLCSSDVRVALQAIPDVICLTGQSKTLNKNNSLYLTHWCLSSIDHENQPIREWETDQLL